MYKWQQVKMLRFQGVSIKKIARKLKLSKNTVRKYLRCSDPPEFKAREYQVKLDSYRDQVKRMHAKGYIGTRVFDELVKLGYEGSLSTVHRFISVIKKEEQVNKRVSTRVETAPGKQMQYDWKEWMLPVDGQLLKIYIHSLVLSYSRKKYYAWSLSIGSQDVIRAIEQGIKFFGGAAHELVMDNGKQMVITHGQNDIVRYNDEFLKFCGLYGIEPQACQNYRARTKGKVERPIFYLQEHLLRGLEAAQISEFGPKLSEFTERYNARPHSSLKESPDERFLREKDCLRAIPQIEPQVLYERQIRKISNDGYLSWDGALYPIPMRLCLRQVMVEPVFGRLIKVYEMKGDLACEYQVKLGDQGLRPKHPEHEAVNRDCQERKRRNRNALAEKFCGLFGSPGQVYLAGLRREAGANVYWHLSELLACCELYDTRQIRQALCECIQIGAYHKNSVLRLLSPLKLKGPAANSLLSEICLPSADISRPLSAYAVLELRHE
jgi:transposase